MATAIMKQKEVPEMDDVAEIISKISEDSPYKRRPTQKRTWMTVPEMGKLLGLKKTDRYWLVHKNVFESKEIAGKIRINIASFEKWYANQVKYKKVGGEEPGKELREKSYSFKEAANILGIHDCDLYDIWKNEKLEYITVDFVRRIPVDIFEKWYADQDVYRKVTHIPTAEELENDYICLQDAADLLGISREKLAKIARREEIGRLLDSTICNNKRWITRKSFQLFLNAQNVYYIMNDGDKQEESQLLQENETLSLEIKEYISRQDAAELAGVSVSTVTKWMQSGEFQCVGAGKVLRVHRQQFLNWLNEHREGVI